jgi:hypothetical protein
MVVYDFTNKNEIQYNDKKSEDLFTKIIMEISEVIKDADARNLLQEQRFIIIPEWYAKKMSTCKLLPNDIYICQYKVKDIIYSSYIGTILGVNLLLVNYSDNITIFCADKYYE